MTSPHKNRRIDRFAGTSVGNSTDMVKPGRYSISGASKLVSDASGGKSGPRGIMCGMFGEFGNDDDCARCEAHNFLRYASEQ